MKLTTLVYFILLVVVTSCQSYHPKNKYNYFSGKSLYNEPLNLKLTYFGDINFEPLNSLDRKKVRKTTKKLKEVKERDLLAYGLTDLGPHYELMLFVRDIERNSRDTKGVHLVLTDTVDKTVLYEKVAEEKIAYLLVRAVAANKSMTSIRKDGEYLTRNLTFDTVFEEELTYSNVFESNKHNPNYLATRKKLKDAPITRTEENQWMKFQFLVTVNSFMGNNSEYDSLVQDFEKNRKRDLAPVLDTLLLHPGLIKNRNVLEKLSSLAAGTRVFMLNENHWYPKHRLFGQLLLKPLKEKGYTHLALEGLFDNQDSLINSRGFPSYSSGYYTREPLFGNFIRRAKELGFQIVGYENDKKGVNRELGQAQNLAELLNHDPDAKVFVYAGLDHIIEEPTERGKSMAVHLRKLTNINPLTINQTDVVSETKDKLVMIQRDQLKNVKKLQRWSVDFFIVNNLEPQLGSFLPQDDLKKVEIADEIFEKHIGANLLVTVYKLDEYNSLRSRSVPITSSLKRISNEKKIELTLPSGNFIIKISSSEDERVLTKEIHV